MRCLVAIAAAFIVAPGVAAAGVQGNIVGKGGGSSGAALLLDCAISSDLTCTTGETLTFTRSGTGATCMATGLSEDTTVAAGPAENVACFNDVHGVRIVGAIKNELCASETFDDSVGGCGDWLDVTMPATVTLDQDDAPLVGVDTLADKITDDDGVLAERVRQSVALSTAGKYRESVWLRDTAAHTASLQVEVDTAATPTTQTCNVSVLTTNKRFDCVLDATGLTFANVETRIYPTVSTDGALQDDVFAWGAQLIGPSATNVGSFLRPYCRSTGASATTCNREVLSIPTSEFKQASADMDVDYTPIYNPNDSATRPERGIIWGTSIASASVNILNTGVARIHDGTAATDLALNAGYTAGVTRRIGAEWIGGVMRSRSVTDGTVASGAYDGSFVVTEFTLGGISTDAHAGWGYYKHAQIYSKPTTRGPTAPHFTYLTGASGTYASTPDSAALDITGDIDLRARAAAVDWTPSAFSTFVAKNVSATTNAGYIFGLQTSGSLHLSASRNGNIANREIYDSTVSVGVDDGARKHVRGALDVNDGAGNSVATFYTSDDGITWTQLGATVTKPSVTIFANTANAEVGSHNTGASAIAGKVYSAEIRNGIDGTVVAKFDAGDGTPYVSTSFVSSTTGETWTLNGDAKLYR